VRNLMGATPQEEAIAILAGLLSEFRQADPPLEPILRQCVYVCQILGWTQAHEWFHRELNGYPAIIARPYYRLVPGMLVWRPGAGSSNTPGGIAERVYYGAAPEEEVEESATLDVHADFSWILQASKAGYSEDTGERMDSKLRSGTPVKLRRLKVFRGVDFLNCIATIRNQTFDFIAQSLAQLNYGDAMEAFWEARRTRLDALLQPLGFANHLTEIESGLASKNPESWRSAVYACRSLLSDLAAHLWRDPRPTYEHLDGDGPDGKLNVTSDKFANRLSAYIHQRGLVGSMGSLLRQEGERLSVSIRSLVSAQGEAHSKIGHEDAVSIALLTYLILGEIVLKTDMKPIEKYGDPNPSMISDQAAT
jgi:hypothetical protein